MVSSLVVSESETPSLRGTVMQERFLRPETSDIEWIVLALSVVLFLGVACFGFYKFCYVDRQRRRPPLQSISTPPSTKNDNVLDGDTSSVSDCSEMTDPASIQASSTPDTKENEDLPASSALEFEEPTIFQPSNIVDSSMEVYAENDELDVSTDYSLKETTNDSIGEEGDSNDCLPPTPKSPESISSTSLYVADSRVSPHRVNQNANNIDNKNEMNTSGSDESDATGLWDYSVAGETTITNMSRYYNTAASLGAGTTHSLSDFQENADSSTLNMSHETDDNLFSNPSFQRHNSLKETSVDSAKPSFAATVTPTASNKTRAPGRRKGPLSVSSSGRYNLSSKERTLYEM